MIDDSISDSLKTEGRWFFKHIAIFVTMLTIIVAPTATLFTMLYSDMRDLERQVAQLQANNAVLRLQVEMQYDISPKATVVNVLDSLDRPAWCNFKNEDLGLFVMHHINPTYESVYGVPVELYEGRTHSDIHGEELGEIYEANDRTVYETRSFRSFYEPVDTLTGAPSEKEIWKFYLRTRDGTDFVCGIQVNL